MTDHAVQQRGEVTAGVIAQTCITIDLLAEELEAKRAHRHARRDRIRCIDEVLNEFEMLNLAEEEIVPVELRGKAQRIVTEQAHPISSRQSRDLRIADWMEALYEVQDTLMVPAEDGMD